jgi:hypothetical protein
LRRAWQALLQRLRRGAVTGADGHPTPELLSAYQEDRLPPEADGEIQEHFVDCPECPELMLDLDRFTSPQAVEVVQAGVPEPWVEAAWRRLSSRLASEVRPPWRRRPRGPLLGWAMTTLLIPCSLGLWLRVDALTGEVRDLTAPQLNPPSWEIEPEPRLRGGDPLLPEIEVPAGARRFLLVLSSPEAPSQRTYRLEIQSWQRERLWEARGLAMSPEGTFTVAVSSRFLPAGNYRFLVTGIGENNEEPFTEEFPVRLSYL